jgi:transposase
MPTERLCMRHTREILRHKWLLGSGHRLVTASLNVSHGVITDTTQRALRAGLDWDGVGTLSDSELEQKLYPPPPTAGTPRALPDFALLEVELRHKGVTLELLHQEYLEKNPDGYRRSAFCAHYDTWKQARGLSMRQIHHGGDKLFVDYAGMKAYYTDPATGEGIACELFVAALGASSYTYAEATRSQKVPDFLASHVRALAFLGGVPVAVVSDQLKSGVILACRYEPGLNTSYLDFAQHYGTALVPARPRSPKDKAKVEVAVQIAERWILARLRHVTCFSLAELNRNIGWLLEDLNNRPMRVYKKSRRELFVELDRPVLRPLPETPYEYSEWKKARVNLDYHVELSGHYYSVPYRLVHQAVELRFTQSLVEVLHDGKRVALHRRSLERGRFTTLVEHMPPRHQGQAEQSPQKIQLWAHQIGPMTEELCDRILREKPHPEQGYRACMGIARLGKRFGHDRVEAAATRALWTGAVSYRSVRNMLEAGLDRSAVFEDSVSAAAPVRHHEHLRGPGYYC